ncbi:hypothetical protein LCGC14_2921010, partial [marine sediment metagenome]
HDVTGTGDDKGRVVRVTEMPVMESSGGVFLDVYPGSEFIVDVVFSGETKLRSNRVSTPPSGAAAPGAGGSAMPEEHFRQPGEKAGQEEEFGYEE